MMDSNCQRLEAVGHKRWPLIQHFQKGKAQRNNPCFNDKDLDFCNSDPHLVFERIADGEAAIHAYNFVSVKRDAETEKYATRITINMRRRANKHGGKKPWSKTNTRIGITTDVTTRSATATFDINNPQDPKDDKNKKYISQWSCESKAWVTNRGQNLSFEPNSYSYTVHCCCDFRPWFGFELLVEAQCNRTAGY